MFAPVVDNSIREFKFDGKKEFACTVSCKCSIGNGELYNPAFQTLGKLLPLFIYSDLLNVPLIECFEVHWNRRAVQMCHDNEPLMCQINLRAQTVITYNDYLRFQCSRTKLILMNLFGIYKNIWTPLHYCFLWKYKIPCFIEVAWSALLHCKKWQLATVSLKSPDLTHRKVI